MAGIVGQVSEPTAPEVSIVLPTYNGSQYLESAIQSCLSQTWEDLELIVVDDCSTDSVPEILAGCDDPRIRIIRNESNLKLPASLNKGFSQARGRLLTWTSDDNLYEPDAIQKMRETLLQDYDVTYAEQAIIDQHGLEVGLFGIDQPEMLRTRNIVNACFLYHRHVHEALGGYDETLFLVEDWDFFLRALDRFRFAITPGVLYKYRRHGESLTETRRAEACRALARMFESRVRIDQRTSRARHNKFLECAIIFLDGEDRASALRCWRKALAAQPLGPFTRTGLRLSLEMIRRLRD